MKRLRLLLIAAAMMAALFITPASALEYTFDSPSTGDFGTPTSAGDIIRERENPNTDPVFYPLERQRCRLGRLPHPLR